MPFQSGSRVKAGSAPARGQPSPLGPGREPGQRPRALRGRGAGGGSGDKAAHARVGGRRHTGGRPPAAGAGYLRGECRCAGRAPPLTSAHAGGSTQRHAHAWRRGSAGRDAGVSSSSALAASLVCQQCGGVGPLCRSAALSVESLLHFSSRRASAPPRPRSLRCWDQLPAFHFPPNERCASSPERVIFIGLELIFVGGCRLFFWQANAPSWKSGIMVILFCCSEPEL